MEQASAHILASYLDAPTKWGLFNGFSTRPIMPISVKMLFSKKPLKEETITVEEALKDFQQKLAALEKAENELGALLMQEGFEL